MLIEKLLLVPHIPNIGCQWAFSAYINLCGSLQVQNVTVVSIKRTYVIELVSMKY